MKAFDGTHFCKSCGSISYRTLEDSFWCSECEELVVATSIPEQEKVEFFTKITDNSK